MAERTSAVHRFAADAGLAVLTPSSLKGAEAQQAFAAHQADVGVVVAYGLILPKPILAAPREGCLNLHASALPRWRGAAPIQRAIMAGDTETAATVMRMDEGLDTGPVCLTRRLPIGPDMTAGELHDQLAAQGAELMVEALAAIERGALRCTPQPPTASPMPPRSARTRRGSTSPGRPAPCTTTSAPCRRCPGPGRKWSPAASRSGSRCCALRLPRAAAPPARSCGADLTIACGEGALRILEVQRGGKRPMPAEDFLRGFPLRPGHPLGAPPR